MKLHIPAMAQFFPNAEQAEVQAFLTDVRARLNLSGKHTLLILEDHMNALRDFPRSVIYPAVFVPVLLFDREA